jgi:L-ribulose-5-phosphate 3-epimerase
LPNTRDWDPIQEKIGIIQGRLSPLINNKIQSFPWGHWQDEFEICHRLGIRNIEWTIDLFEIDSNPIFHSRGIREITGLSERFDVLVPSVTCDFFMENPPFRNIGLTSDSIKSYLDKLLEASFELGAMHIVIPLVDNSSLPSQSDFLSVVDFLLSTSIFETECDFIFEVDLIPSDFLALIRQLDSRYFGVNLDLGNSASLGWDPTLEVNTLKEFIKNVHVKDRRFRGPSVPLGEGEVDFYKYFCSLIQSGYSGNYIFQTARSTTGEHEQELVKNLGFFLDSYSQATALI